MISRIFKNVKLISFSNKTGYLRSTYFSWKDDRQKPNQNNHSRYLTISLMGLLGGSVLYLCSTKYQKSYCHSLKSTKKYTKKEVKQHTTKENGIWVTFAGKVYDITNFVDEHPGGDKIMMAAGGAVEPFWSLYAVHKESDEVAKILKSLEIGELVIDKDDKCEAIDDPFSNDPERHPALKINSHKPFNAEAPLQLLTDNFITPNSLFFVRNHLPVPHVNKESYRLVITGIGVPCGKIELTLDEIKKLAQSRNITTTIMCAGNRRSNMNEHKTVHGIPWSTGAISTAKWTGVLLVDLLSALGIPVDDRRTLEREKGVKHIQFDGLDTDVTGACYGGSIPASIALDPRAEVLLAFCMNDEELPLDHGFPLRVVIPGCVGARQVKWLHKINISHEESNSFWQRKDYKTFCSSTNPASLNYDEELSIIESNVQSAICVPRDGEIIKNIGLITVKGYAWSGGGRGIMRVEVSCDGGQTWHKADLLQSENEDDNDKVDLYRQKWSWTLWEIDLPVDDDCKQLEIICKAVDVAQNNQPESYQGSWNVRGLMSNAWNKVSVTFT